MKIGFTGTRDGMTAAQRMVVKEELLKATELHHGDCVGSDEDASHAASYTAGVKVVSHPPVSRRYRAYSPAHETRKPEEYLRRNRDIVDECDILIATPAEFTEQPKGGTWYTVRYAMKKRKPVIIIYPDGTVTRHPIKENHEVI